MAVKLKGSMEETQTCCQMHIIKTAFSPEILCFRIWNVTLWAGWETGILFDKNL